MTDAEPAPVSTSTNTTADDLALPAPGTTDTVIDAKPVEVGNKRTADDAELHETGDAAVEASAPKLAKTGIGTNE